MPKDGLLTRSEAAEYIRMSVGWLEKYRDCVGYPKITRLGRKVFYQKHDLDDFVARQEGMRKWASGRSTNLKKAT